MITRSIFSSPGVLQLSMLLAVGCQHPLTSALQSPRHFSALPGTVLLAHTFCLADSVGQLTAPSPGHSRALHSCRHMGKKAEPPQQSTGLHCQRCPTATLVAQGATQGCASNLLGIPSSSKSPAHCTNLAGDTALIPLELEIIFIVVTKFLKPFSTLQTSINALSQPVNQHLPGRS